MKKLRISDFEIRICKARNRPRIFADERESEMKYRIQSVREKEVLYHLMDAFSDPRLTANFRG